MVWLRFWHWFMFWLWFCSPQTWPDILFKNTEFCRHVRSWRFPNPPSKPSTFIATSAARKCPDVSVKISSGFKLSFAMTPPDVKSQKDAEMLMRSSATDKRVCGFTETYNDAVLFCWLSCKMLINNRLWRPELGCRLSGFCKQAEQPGRFWLNQSICVCFSEYEDLWRSRKVDRKWKKKSNCLHVTLERRCAGEERS